MRTQGHQLELQIARLEVSLKHNQETYNLPDLNGRIARLEEGLRHAREKLDQRDTRQFEINKILISALLAAIITGAANAGYQWLFRTFEKTSQRGSPAEKKQ